jgi:hypothetical protein
MYITKKLFILLIAIIFLLVIFIINIFPRVEIISSGSEFYMHVDGQGKYRTLHITGMWLSDTDKNQFPNNSVVIECEEKDSICEVNSAILSQFFGSNGYLFYPIKHSYNIIEWETELLIAENISNCNKTILTINTKTKDVSIITILQNHNDNLCHDDKLIYAKPQSSKLVGGYDYSIRYWK